MFVFTVLLVLAIMWIRKLLFDWKSVVSTSAARMAITASTPIISISVKPWLRRVAAGFVVAEFSFIAVLLFVILFVLVRPIFDRNFPKFLTRISHLNNSQYYGICCRDHL